MMNRLFVLRKEHFPNCCRLTVKATDGNHNVLVPDETPEEAACVTAEVNPSVCTRANIS